LSLGGQKMINFGLEKGMKGVSQVIVNPDNMAENFSKPMPPSFATPMLVSLMDNAAIDAVIDKLPNGYITVGSSISIKHIAPTPEGMAVTAEAELKDIYVNRLIFEVTAYDEIEKIGEIDPIHKNMEKISWAIIDWQTCVSTHLRMKIMKFQITMII